MSMKTSIHLCNPNVEASFTSDVSGLITCCAFCFTYNGKRVSSLEVEGTLANGVLDPMIFHK